jgi:hypothetical protein
MSAFAAAARVLAADPNLGSAASYLRVATNTTHAVRVVRSNPIDADGLSTTRREMASVPAEALAFIPRRGDQLTIGSDVFVVERVERAADGAFYDLMLSQ